MLFQARMCTDTEETRLAKGALPNDSVEIKVVEADLTVEVYWFRGATPHITSTGSTGKQDCA